MASSRSVFGLIQIGAIFLFFAYALVAQPSKYDYPTELRGGYRLIYKEKGDLMFLLLAKGSTTIKRFGGYSVGLPLKNLGYIAADFPEHFVLAHSFGSGNPHEIELIRKRDGKNLLESTAVWVDSRPKQNALLYAPKLPLNYGDRVILYDIGSGKKRSFVLPVDIFKENMVYSRITIAELTREQLIITYQVGSSSKTKTYRIR